jgi:conjugal transfer/entry exclusion protein
MSKFWFAAVLSVTLVSATAFAQCPKHEPTCLDPSNYPQTIMVTVSKVEDIVTGSNSSIKTTQPLFPVQPTISF